MLIENVCFVESLNKFDAYCIWDLEVGWLGCFGFNLRFVLLMFHEMTVGGNVEPQFDATTDTGFIKIHRNVALTSRIIPVASS